MGLMSFGMDREARATQEVRHQFHYDEAADQFIVESKQDIEPVLADNREMRRADDGYTQDRSMKRVGRIPLVVVEKIKKEQGWDPMDPNNSQRLLQLLDDPDYSHFKTSDGKHARKTQRHFMRASTGRAVTKPVFFGDD